MHRPVRLSGLQLLYRDLDATPDSSALAVRLYNEKKTPVAKICQMMGITKPTHYAYVRDQQN